MDGVEIRWNDEAEPYNKITSISINGQAFDDEQEYLVGTIDMFTFGVGYETIKGGTDVRFYLPEFIRDVLERELQDSSALSESHRLRWVSSQAGIR